MDFIDVIEIFTAYKTEVPKNDLKTKEREKQSVSRLTCNESDCKMKELIILSLQDM